MTVRARRHGGDGEFRDVGVLRHQAGDAAQPEARAEAVDEMRQLGIVAGSGAGGKRGLHRIAALGDEGGEPHHVEAEAGIAGVADGGEPVGEQADDAGRPRAAARRSRPRSGTPCCRCETARPAGAARPPRAAPSAARAGRRACSMVPSTSRFEPDRIGEALLRHIGRQRQARRDRLVLAAERLIDAADEDFAEARGERRARQVDEIADRFEPDLGERRDRLRREAQRRGRQRQQRRAHPLRRHQRGLAIMRDAPRRSRRCRRRRRGHAKPCAARRASEVAAQARPRRRTDGRSR